MYNIKNHNHKLIIPKQKGFTLIEAMIAVVVFAFGLLGVAGVMTVSVKNNYNGYMRSQATFLASSMADLMSRNQIALQRDEYNGTYSTTSTPVSCDNCDPLGLATRDTTLWSNMIQQTFPNANGIIACVSNGPPATPIVEIPDPSNPGSTIDCLSCAIAPYNGFCTITINWSESNNNGSSSPQTFSLVTKP